MDWEEDDYATIMPAIGPHTRKDPPGQPDRKKEGDGKKKERIISPLKIAAGALAAVTAAFLGSLLGNNGTLIGVAIASVISGTGSVLYEHGARQALQRAQRDRATRGAAGLAGVRASVVLPRQPANRRSFRFSWRIAAMAAGSMLVIAGAAYAAVTVTELITGNTLHGITTGTHDPGTTIGGNTQPASTPVQHHHRHRHHHATVTPTPTPTPSLSPTVSSSPSSTPTITPSISPSPSSIPTLSVTPPRGTGKRSPSPGNS